MKKLFICLGILASSLLALAEEPNEKVMAAFEKTFPQASEVKWTETDYTYEANFRSAEVISRIIYDKEGNILKCYRSYFENNLPILILSRIKQAHSDKNIYGVTEVSSGEGTAYYVILHDDEKWYEVVSDNYGNLSMKKKFRKG